MTLIMSEVEIARPPQEVFGYVTDPSRFGEWQAGVVSGYIEGDGPPGVGSRCVIPRRIGGAKRTVISEIKLLSTRTWAGSGNILAVYQPILCEPAPE